MVKKIITAVITALLLIGITSFFLNLKSFENLLGTNEGNITKVAMVDGNNGNHVVTEDKEKIKELINLVNNRHYIKSLNQKHTTGYSYAYDFYSGDKVLLTISGHGYNVNVNGSYYYVSKPISLSSLKNWFNSLPVIINN